MSSGLLHMVLVTVERELERVCVNTNKHGFPVEGLLLLHARERATSGSIAGGKGSCRAKG